MSTGIKPLVYYDAKISAMTSAGEGPAVEEFQLAVGYPDKPGKPAKPTVKPISNDTVEVTFVLPDSYYGSIPTKIYIYYQQADSVGAPIKSLSGEFPLKSKFTISDLSLTNYHFWSKGENALGESEPSEKTIGMPLPPTTQAPTTTLPPTTTAAPTNKSVIVIVNPDIPVVARSQAEEPVHTKMWFILVLVAAGLLILVLIAVVLLMRKKGKGVYNVDKKESKYADDGQPLQDYADYPDDHYDALLNEKKPPRSASQNSLIKPGVPPATDGDSLDDYGEDTNFNDNASFIGQYGGTATDPATTPQVVGDPRIGEAV
jgi:hypothetical protein